MKASALIAWLLFSVFSSSAKAVHIPTIFWSPNNELFTKDRTLCFRIFDTMEFMCPNRYLFFLSHTPGAKRDDLHENLWFVGKDAYDTCKVNGTSTKDRLIYKCLNKDESVLTYQSVEINLQQADPKQPIFDYNQMHHFISTSNGSLGSLNSTEGGHCRTDNMRLRFFFYRPRECEDCTENDRTGKRLDYFFCEPKCAESQNGTLTCRMNWLDGRNSGQTREGEDFVRQTEFLWIPENSHSVSFYKASPQNVGVACPTDDPVFIVEHDNVSFCAKVSQLKRGKMMACSEPNQELMSSRETPDLRCFSVWTNKTGTLAFKAALTVTYIKKPDASGAEIQSSRLNLWSAVSLLAFLLMK